ncbi:60S ribosomal protein l11 [Phtheirospermum japonicum]|uniref:60S ribosomal protein l11 n=1 Tax=Phtheirospermum japonicum TaxID=374723 RepID=A0A830CFS6_9LAMI|nr:60S ribosomal protein l11 [Phtheirospermum japonicum]
MFSPKQDTLCGPLVSGVMKRLLAMLRSEVTRQCNSLRGASLVLEFSTGSQRRRQ